VVNDWSKTREGRKGTMPIVVGREAAQTPSLFSVFSSIPDATICVERGTPNMVKLNVMERQEG
jgi:hypothetical protein